MCQKKIIKLLLTIGVVVCIAAFSQCKSFGSLPTESIQDADVRTSHPILKAIINHDLNYLKQTFAPEFNFHFILSQAIFSESDYEQMLIKKGMLYDIIYSDAIMKRNIGPQAVSLSQAILQAKDVRVKMGSLQPKPGLFAISMAHRSINYDLIFNCTNKAWQCEWIELAVSKWPIDSQHFEHNLTVKEWGNFYSKDGFARLLEKTSTAKMRQYIINDAIQLLVPDPQEVVIFGPAAPFKVLYSAEQNGSGKVVIIEVDRATKKNSDLKSILQFHHLTHVSPEVGAALVDKFSMKPGAYIGKASAKVGFYQDTETLIRVSVEGRNQQGLPLCAEEILQVLQGK